LRDIVCERPVVDDAEDQVEDRPLVAPDDLVKSRLRAGQRLRDELRVRWAVRIDRDDRPLSGHTAGGHPGFHPSVTRARRR
jgi:hypothetical protein